MMAEFDDAAQEWILRNLFSPDTLLGMPVYTNVDTGNRYAGAPDDLVPGQAETECPYDDLPVLDAYENEDGVWVVGGYE
jgi:hypothetical protein